MTKTAYDFYNEAIALRNNIVAGKTNETPIMAWAAVCRACAKANNAKRNEMGRNVATRLDLSFFNNLDRVWWVAKAQVETLGRGR